MNRQALRLAIVVTAATSWLLLATLAHFERRALGGERARQLVTVKHIERGALITDDMLSERDVPVAYAQDRAVRREERAKVVGSRMGVALGQNQTLLWTDLAPASDERRDFSCVITPGKRAVTVLARAEVTETGVPVGPGDYVDVRADVRSRASGNGGRQSVVLLKRLLVLAAEPDPSAAGLASAPPAQSGGPPSVVSLRLTLSLNVREVQYLALADHDGELTVSSRPPGDYDPGDEPPGMRSRSSVCGGLVRLAQ